MSAPGPNDDWAPSVVSFLSDRIPMYQPGEWSHAYISAYEMGCEALAALGQAKEVDGGAIALPDPELPKILPRWDDICIAILTLADQVRELDHRTQDGSPYVPPQRAGRVIRPGSRPPVAPPNIHGDPPLGPSRASGAVIDVLTSLALAKGPSWTTPAREIFFRDPPVAWGSSPMLSPVFADALQNAVETMPDQIRAQITDAVQVDEQDMEEARTRHQRHIDDMKERMGAKADHLEVPSDEKIRDGLLRTRGHRLDWIFFRRWRLGDGWLDDDEARRALEIFHDRLAIQMRRAVMEQLHPEDTQLHRR